MAQSKLAQDPRLVTMWSGYAFATDFREERGHAYALVDQRDIETAQKNDRGAATPTAVPTPTSTPTTP